MAKAKASEDMKLVAQGLAGQVRDQILEIVKGMRKAWADTPEAEQVAYIKSTGDFAAELVENIMDVVATEGAIMISAYAKNVTTKEDVVSGTVTVDRSDPNSEAFTKAAHKPCKLAFFANQKSILNMGDEPKPDPDQRPMFDDDEEEQGNVTTLPVKNSGKSGVGSTPKKRGRPKKKSSGLGTPKATMTTKSDDVQDLAGPD